MVRKTTSSSIERAYGVIPVLKKDGEEPLFLLLLHRAGHWALPKGRPEPGEGPVGTALREFKEETGIGGCRVYPHKTFTEHYLKGSVRKTVTYYLGFVTNPHVRIQEAEISDSRWLKFDGALQKATFEETRRVLRLARDFLRRRPDVIPA